MRQRNNIHPRERQRANHTHHSFLHTSGKTVYLPNHDDPLGVLENADTIQKGVAPGIELLWDLRFMEKIEATHVQG